MGWSRAVLEIMLANRLHLRQGTAPSNSPATLAGADSDLVQEITRDPYVFDSSGCSRGTGSWMVSVSTRTGATVAA